MVVDVHKRIATAAKAEKPRLSDRTKRRAAMGTAVLIIIGLAALGALFPYL